MLIPVGDPGEETLFFPQFAFLCNADSVSSIDHEAYDRKRLRVYMSPTVSHREKRMLSKLEHRRVLQRLCLQDASTYTDVGVGPHGIITCKTMIEGAQLVTCHVPSY